MGLYEDSLGVLKDIWNLQDRLREVIGDEIKSAFKSFTRQFPDFRAVVRSELNRALGDLARVPDEIKDVLRSQISEIDEGIKNIYDFISDEIKDNTKVVENAFSSVVNSLRGEILGEFDKAAMAIAGVKNAVRHEISSVVGDITDEIEKSERFLKGEIARQLESTKNEVVGEVEREVAGLSSGLKALADAVERLPTAFAQAFLDEIERRLSASSLAEVETTDLFKRMIQGYMTAVQEIQREQFFAKIEKKGGE